MDGASTGGGAEAPSLARITASNHGGMIDFIDNAFLRTPEHTALRTGLEWKRLAKVLHAVKRVERPLREGYPVLAGWSLFEKMHLRGMIYGERNSSPCCHPLTAAFGA